MLDPSEIRRDFPVLALSFHGKRLIYFDNAATTQKPLPVIRAIEEFYRKRYANVGRGVYDLAVAATQAYEDARRVVAGLIGARPEELVFTQNTTMSINLAAYSLVASGILRRGRNIVTTLMEHHSDLLPWHRAASISGAELKIVGVDDKGRLELGDVEKAVDDDTAVVAISHVSNVTGVVNPVSEICGIAHEKGALCLVDGAQSVPHMPVKVDNIDADFLAFSGHKMMGPMGIGGLYIKEELLETLTTPFVGGGTVKDVEVAGSVKPQWVEPPHRFEAGTPNVAGAVGLAEAVRYLSRVGTVNVEEHEKKLVERLMKGLEELNVVIYGPAEPEERSGIVSFNMRGIAPHDLAAILSDEAIAVRSGLFCAAPLMKRLGAERGAVRVSFYMYNTEEEVERFLEVLKRVEGLINF